MGFQDALHALRLAVASDEAVAFADTSMKAISYFAISASVDLAVERGRYPSFRRFSLHFEAGRLRSPVRGKPQTFV